MLLTTPHKDTLRSALVGGLCAVAVFAGLFVTVDLNPGMAGSIAIIGGVVAGYRTGEPRSAAATAGAGAGVVGATPGLVLLAPQVVEMATAWPTPSGVVVAALGGVVLPVVGSALVGLLGGLGGRWLATRVAGDPATPTGA
jgi:hypothetical protein